MTTTAADRLTAAEADVAKAGAAMTAARQARDELRSTITKERQAYLDASGTAFLDGADRPSRERLDALERQLPDAEDLVDRLIAALTKAEHRWREAKADVLAGEANAMREETARRQARIDELQPQLAAIQQEIYEHSRWIGNEGPVKIGQLEAEARQLRSGLA